MLVVVVVAAILDGRDWRRSVLYIVVVQECFGDRTLTIARSREMDTSS
jgi:hypothetical protein